MKRTPLKRGKKLNPVNRKRKAENHKRAYGGQAFLNYIHRLPCWACGYAGPSPRQAAHTINGGLSRKADASSIIALCNVCHSKQHAQGWLAIGMTDESRKRAAAQTWASWEARRGDSQDDDEGAGISDDTEGEEDADA